MSLKKNITFPALTFFGRNISTGHLFFYFFIFIILAFGITFRTWGVLPESLDLWADEAWWAAKLADRGVFDLGFRPIGYMWLCKQLSGFENQELMLRLPSLISSTGFLVCIFLCAKTLLKNHLIIIFCVFLAAFHPKLIVFAKEFKPYSVEVFIHGMLIFWALNFYKKKPTIIEFVGVAIFSGLFCYNAIFLFPAVLLWITHTKILNFIRISYNKYKNLLNSQKIIFAIFISLIITILTVSIQYGVFPIDKTSIAAISWYVRNTLEILSWPGALHSNFESTTLATATFFSISSIAGVISFLKEKQYLTLFLLSSAVIFSAIANMIGSWPYGVFRTNLFFIPGILLILCYGLDRIIIYKYFRLPIYTLVIATMLIFLPTDLSYHKFKQYSEWAPSPQLTKVLDELLIRYQHDNYYKSNIIITDWHSWRPVFYYLNTHPVSHKAYATLKENAQLIKGPINDQKKMLDIILSAYEKNRKENANTRIWLIITKLKQFPEIRSNKFIKTYKTYEKEFATHDKDYHPLLIELSF